MSEANPEVENGAIRIGIGWLTIYLIIRPLLEPEPTIIAFS